jgi:hypothetical protein
MDFNKLVEDVLNEMPFDSVLQVRSQKFTGRIPPRAKFKEGERVKLRNLTMASNPASRKYGPGAEGWIVGMQRNTGPGRTAFGADPMNRYYVQFEEDGKIYPIASFHLTHAE